MAFILIGNQKVRLPKGETDVEGFEKVVDSIYKICTQKNLITGKTPTPDDLADIKFPPSLKTALIEKGVKFWSKMSVYQREELASKKDVQKLIDYVEKLSKSFDVLCINIFASLKSPKLLSNLSTGASLYIGLSLSP